MDRQHHCAQLACRQPTSFQDIHWESSLSHGGPCRSSALESCGRNGQSRRLCLARHVPLGTNLLWNGPSWLRLDATEWPEQPELTPNNPSEEGDEVCLHATVSETSPVIPIDRFSSFTRLKRVTAWVLRFVHNCQAHKRICTHIIDQESRELELAESYWVLLSQRAHFSNEIGALKAKAGISQSVASIPGLVAENKIQSCPTTAYTLSLYVPNIHCQSCSYAPNTFAWSLAASLSRRFHIIRGRSIISRNCVTCRYKSSRPQPQIMGQLPMERVTPDSIFSNVGVDYAGPSLVLCANQPL